MLFVGALSASDATGVSAFHATPAPHPGPLPFRRGEGEISAAPNDCNSHCGWGVSRARFFFVVIRGPPCVLSLILMHIRFFAQLKDAAGCASVEMAVPVPISGEQLWAALLERFPKLEAHRRTVRLAKNSEYAAADALFADGDEVALIPPVSGG